MVPNKKGSIVCTASRAASAPAQAAALQREQGRRESIYHHGGELSRRHECPRERDLPRIIEPA